MNGETPRPFRILGLQQVALGSLDRRSFEPLWVGLLGLVPASTYCNAAENVDELILSVGKGVLAAELDLMQPIDATQKPAVHQPTLNHFGLWVDNLPAAHQWLASQGVRFTPGGIRRGASGYDVCFIHPKPSGDFPISGQGVLIELVQAPPEVIAAWAAQHQ